MSVEMVCTTCRETFLADDEDDRIHVEHEDGTACGGWGVTRPDDRPSPIWRRRPDTNSNP